MRDNLVIKCPGPPAGRKYDGRCVRGEAYMPAYYTTERAGGRGGGRPYEQWHPGGWAECPVCGGENHVPVDVDLLTEVALEALVVRIDGAQAIRRLPLEAA